MSSVTGLGASASVSNVSMEGIVEVRETLD